MDEVNNENVDIDEFPYQEMFLTFQKELDNRNDKYERLVKLSRDITIESKRVIFQLHRVLSSSNPMKALQDCQNKISWVQRSKWRYVAEELYGEDPYQYLRAYSPGLQEYIEALSFLYYLTNSSLISLQAVSASLQFNVEFVIYPAGTRSATSDEQMIEDVKLMSVNVPPIEYLMGIADLTGELMRLAINSVAHGPSRIDTKPNKPESDALNATDSQTIPQTSQSDVKSSQSNVICDFSPFTICRVLQEVQITFSSLSGQGCRDLGRKLAVMRQCERKVEAACYALMVRGSEMPKHLLADSLSRVAVGSNNYDGTDENDQPLY